ncbi:hypothetical protein BR93DRAFT_931129 [Coniochaeta sp. PMI_546]|nr:hypothetical protein BR93DRAFT_931129 [Coniochaeta sp. PMI_546]
MKSKPGLVLHYCQGAHKKTSVSGHDLFEDKSATSLPHHQRRVVMSAMDRDLQLSIQFSINAKRKHLKRLRPRCRQTVVELSYTPASKSLPRRPLCTGLESFCSLSPPSCCQPTSLITPGSSPRIDQRATSPYCTLTASEPCLNRQRHSLIPYLPLVALDIHSTNRRAWHKGTCSTLHLHKALQKRRLFLEIENTLIGVCPGIDPGTPRRQKLQSVP